MRDFRRYIGQWLSALLVLLLTACSSGNDESQPDSQPVLKIYVFAPDHPIVTRADNGDVDAIDVEKKINSLHVWVFEHENGNYIGHISLSNVSLSETAGNEVTMELSDAFANTPNTDKPHVDVYVVANATAANCGISLDATTTREDLDNALIKEDFFGVSNLIKTVPTDGLPMSGVMKDKKITGSKPVYQVSEDGGDLANVRLVRAVSKVRFVVSKSTSNEDELTINSITLDDGVIPNQEYLFLDGAYPNFKSHVKTAADYVMNASSNPLVSDIDGDNIKRNDSPASYSWDGVMSGQEYENLINSGISLGRLSDLGTFYLRESDKVVKGKFNYTLKHEDEEPVTRESAFTMHDAGDFTRNHTWIVYAYFVSSGDLIMGMVEVKDWTSSENTSQNVYNW